GGLEHQPDWRDAADVHLLRRARRHHAIAVPAVIAGDRDSRNDLAQAIGAIQTAGVWARRAVRHGFVRHRVSGAIAAGIVALSALPDLGDGRGGDPVLEWHLLGGFVSDRGADRRAHRLDQYDGVHAFAVQRPAGAGAVRAGSADRDRAALGARCAVAN